MAASVACNTSKSKLDSSILLGALGVQSIGGTLAALLIGVFTVRVCWDIDGDDPPRLIEEETLVFVGQIIAVIVTWAFAVIATLVILEVLDLDMGLRVTQDGEIQG